MIEKMIGKVATKIEKSNKELAFEFNDGARCKFYHKQDCCESVYIEDICGDLDDLIGVPILVADERVSNVKDRVFDVSKTWTFYAFRTIKGSVDIRWCGTSNGYYSERVDISWED